MSRRDWIKTILLLTPGIGVILLLIGTVVYIAVAQSFGMFNLNGEDHLTIAFWTKMFGRKLYARSLNYSLYVGFWSALLSVALADPIAIWLRKPFPGSTAIGAILKAPLLVHGLVAAFLFVNVIAYHGIVNQFMMAIGLWSEPKTMQNDLNAIGILVLQVWKNMPMALLILTGSVISISDDVLDAARDLGASGFSRFRKIIAPLTLSAMQAALVIIFIGAVADFSFQTIAGPTNRQSLAQLMVFFKGHGRWHDAAVVGSTLMFVALFGSALLAVAVRFVVKGGRFK